MKNLPPTPEGWELVTDSDYGDHTVFIKRGGKGFWSLTPCDDNGTLWVLLHVEKQFTSRVMSLDEAVKYAK